MMIRNTIVWLVAGLLLVAGIPEVLAQGGSEEDICNDEPYVFNRRGNTGRDLILKVTKYVRPGEGHITPLSTDEPADDEESVIVGLDLSCTRDGLAYCIVYMQDFILIGEMGITYEPHIVVSRNPLVAFPKLRKSLPQTGDLVFFIHKDDTHLRLEYRPIAARVCVVYEVEPTINSGLQVGVGRPVDVYTEPRPYAPVVGTLEPDTRLIAYGRSDDEDWLQIVPGWVLAKQLELYGDVTWLPVTFE